MSKKYIIKTIEEEKDYHPFSIRKSIALTQTWWYGDLQRNMGRRVLRVAIFLSDELLGYGQVVVYPFWKNFSYAYLPYGPVLKKENQDIYIELSDFIQDYFKDQNLVCVRLEVADSLSKHFKKTPDIFVRGGFVQPRFEWDIPLLDSDEALFASYHKQTRKNIRKAESLGVYVKIFDKNLEENFDIFISVLKQTADRKSFSLHKEEYYRHMVKILDKEKNGFWAIAYGKDGTVLSLSLHAIVGEMVYGLFGGSINERREEYGPFILKYYAMKYARTRLASSFSIGGIIPPGEDKRYKSWQGFSHFKKSFGGQYLMHDVLVDFVKRRSIYNLVCLLKCIKRLFWGK